MNASASLDAYSIRIEAVSRSAYLVETDDGAPGRLFRTIGEAMDHAETLAPHKFYLSALIGTERTEFRPIGDDR